MDHEIVVHHRQSMVLQWVPLGVAQTNDVFGQIVPDAISWDVFLCLKCRSSPGVLGNVP